jgi:DNA invertase Pin-like site-specific DNA recombinase
MVTSMIIGYARASTSEQDTATQLTALKAAGCEPTFQERASGGRSDQPEINKLLDQLRNGEVLTIMEPVQERKAALRSLTDAPLFGGHPATVSRPLQRA